MEMILQYLLASKQIWLDAVQVAQSRQQRHEYRRYLGEQCFMVTWMLSAKNNSAPVDAQPDLARVLPWIRIHRIGRQLSERPTAKKPGHSTQLVQTK